jgi:hypothetical protein
MHTAAAAQEAKILSILLRFLLSNLIIDVQ